MNEWISVEDRLPENGNWVLGRVNWKPLKIYLPEVVFYDCEADKWYYDGKVCFCIGDWVTHWMPLPEPPKVSEV